MNNTNNKYNGRANWETWEFINFISSYEPLYLIMKDFITTYRKENEVYQLDIEFGLLAHAFIEHAKRLIAINKTIPSKIASYNCDGCLMALSMLGKITPQNR